MNTVKNSVIIFIASLACFFFLNSGKTKALNVTVAVSANNPVNENACFGASSVSYLILAVSTEDSSTYRNNNQSLNKRTIKAESSQQTKTFELAQINSCSKYILFSKNNIDRFQSTDKIFPFQYFW